MTLHGWRQLIEWSLKHACMEPQEYELVYARWEARWEDFLQDLITHYRGNEKLDEIRDEHRATMARKRKDAEDVAYFQTHGELPPS